MKTQSLKHLRIRGSTLMLTLFVTAIVGFVLAAYLTLVKSQNQNVARSQAWNYTVSVIEAGVEDALTHLNRHGSTNLLCDGWQLVNGEYVMQRAVGDSYYVVAISNYVAGASNNMPSILSQGYVQMPVVVASAQTALFAAAGVTELGAKNYMARGVRATTRRDYIFVKGMVAKDSIDLNGNNIRTDSFDSTDPAWSVGGRYVAGLFKDNGDVAVNSSLLNSLNIGNADILGRVSTGPNGTTSIGPNGTVGSKAFHAAGNNGIQPGWSSHDMNVDFPDAKVPFSGGAFTPAGGTIVVTNQTYATAPATTTWLPSPIPGTGVTTNNGSVTSVTYPNPVPATPVTTNTTFRSNENNYPAAGTYLGAVVTRPNGKYDYYQITGYTYTTVSYTYLATTTNVTTTTVSYNYILDDGNYQADALNGTVYVRGNAVLYVVSTLDLTDLTIQPGKSLKLYSGAASVGLSGNNVANSDGTADSFSYYGLPSNTSVTFSGNSSFTGTIYAPNAAFTLNGGGNNNTDFIGASITKSATLNGHFNFHYDEALGRIGPTRGYVVNGWNELNPSELRKYNLSGFSATYSPNSNP